MPLSDIINVEKQLAFYGAYHSNKINVLIHVVCVPLIVWSFQALVAPLPVPSFFPAYHHVVNNYMVFDVNYATVMGVVYLAYYFMLEPIAALLYTPMMTVTVLTATAFSQRPGFTSQAIAVHAFSWIAQFAGHGFAEGRAPALLDNLLGAVVLAPFFVHLEVLFHLGYRPTMQKRINNAIGVEITKIRKADGEKRRKTQ
ncbi:2-hydroxy-palmitic acid dioxygenase mpo1 [Psilocybe cubensis]|uniref:DUF962-domain-containing protein n=2 Tax=Psilocybe cubensis TaxID=181762 RepID=A0A8H7XY99_PSICU|nr:2-hydroxy-palmitic acid dioxygenase mpo1 [Psilocybe cubensis]KAH9482429.1 2-hydroxy-palmitic acid dioxygenase mpo1 [Psilocybe cubensis]